MRRLISDLCLFVLLPIWLLLGVAQAQFNSFPPGVFTGRAALDAAGGAPTFTTLNPSDKSANVTLSGGNLVATGTGAGNVRSIASHSSGLYYCEFTVTALDQAYAHSIGNGNSSASLTSGPGSPDTNSSAYYSGDPAVYVAGASGGTTGVSYGVSGSDVVGMAVDMNNNSIWVRVNGGNWNGSGTANPATNTGGFSLAAISKPWFVITALVSTSASTFNFGATAYGSAAPAGFGNW